MVLRRKQFSGVYQPLWLSCSGLARGRGKEPLWDQDIETNKVKTGTAPVNRVSPWWVLTLAASEGLLMTTRHRVWSLRRWGRGSDKFTLGTLIWGCQFTSSGLWVRGLPTLHPGAVERMDAVTFPAPRRHLAWKAGCSGESPESGEIQAETA